MILSSCLWRDLIAIDKCHGRVLARTRHALLDLRDVRLWSCFPLTCSVLLSYGLHIAAHGGWRRDAIVLCLVVHALDFCRVSSRLTDNISCGLVNHEFGS